MWIFTGAPYIEWINNQPKLKGALTAIMASVVGVILNLSIWFALHVFFQQVSPLKYGLLTLWLVGRCQSCDTGFTQCMVVIKA